MRYQNRQSYRIAWDEAYTHEPEIPLNVDIELASACNAKCNFCLYGDQDWDQSMRDNDWDGKPKRRFMPKETALQIADECHAIGVPAVKVNFRGESTLHPNFSQIISRFSALGFHDLLINTNGNCPEAALPGLMCATRVMVSLDSLDPEIYPTIRKGLSLEKAQHTIDALVSYGHPDLWVRRVICKANKDEAFVDKAKARWPKGIKVSEHFAFDRNHYENQEVVTEDHTKWERTYCGYPSQRVVIDASGRFVPCCLAWSGELDGGMRYPKNSIIEYWNSPWRKKLADELRANVFTNSKCKNCTSFMAFKRPEREYVKDVEGKATING